MNAYVVLCLVAFGSFAQGGGCSLLKFRKLDFNRAEQLVTYGDPLDVSDFADLERVILDLKPDHAWSIKERLSLNKDESNANGLYRLVPVSPHKKDLGDILDVIEVIKDPSGAMVFRTLKNKKAFRHITLAAVYRYVLKAQGYLSLDRVSLQYTDAVESNIVGRIAVYRKWPL